MKYKAVIFDCDGTLLNTMHDLTDAVNYALNQIGLKQQTFQDTLSMVGNGIKELVKRALPNNQQYRLNEALTYFKSYYNLHFADNTEPYNGIIELLDILKEKGYKTCLVSNKNSIYLNLLFNKFFSEKLEFAIGECKNLAPKPAPDMVEEALKRLKIEKKQAVYVGDSEVDVLTAKNSGIDGIFVTWGFSTKNKLLKNGASIIINTPKELVGLV